MNELKLRYRDEIPDQPVWVETRDLLSRSDSICMGSDRHLSFVVWSEKEEIGAIVGQPNPSAIHQAAKDCEEILAFADNIHFVRAHLKTFTSELATILKAPAGPFLNLCYPCRLLVATEIASLSHLHSELRDELFEVAVEGKEIMAAIADNLPVAFAYVASETETLWDLSIDTAPAYRRRGFASAAALSLMRRMAQRSKTAVWGAVQRNVASLALARKLGFIQVDTLWVLSRS